MGSSGNKTDFRKDQRNENMRLLEASVTIKSSLKEAQLEELNSLSRQIAEEVL